MTDESTRSTGAELNGIINVPNEAKTDKSNTSIEKIKSFVSNITVEPIYVFSVLPSGIAYMALQNLNLEKACSVNLQLNDSICYGLSIKDQSMYNQTDEIMVQKYVASMYAWKNVIQSLLPAILLLFLGSWSDRNHRRKPCIMIPMIGLLVSSICYILCTYFFFELPLEYTILGEALPTSLGGDHIVMSMAIYSYVAEISSVKNRTIRMGGITALITFCWIGGIALSGILYVAIGYYGVFSLALVMYAIGLVYGYVRIHDVQHPEIRTNENKVGLIRDLFDIKHIAETCKVTFKAGPNNRRKRILLLILLIMIIDGPIHGERIVMYLFVRFKFQWTEVEYSIFQTLVALAHAFGTVVVLSVSTKFLKLDDALLGVIACVSKLISGLVYAFAPNSTVLYIGVVIEMFNGTSAVAVRTIISKIVPSEELGRINSTLGICQALIPLAYGPLCSLLYKWTIDVLPGSFFLLGSACTFPGIVIFLWLYFKQKSNAVLQKPDE